MYPKIGILKIKFLKKGGPKRLQIQQKPKSAKPKAHLKEAFQRWRSWILNSAEIEDLQNWYFETQVIQ